MVGQFFDLDKTSPGILLVFLEYIPRLNAEESEEKQKFHRLDSANFDSNKGSLVYNKKIMVSVFPKSMSISFSLLVFRPYTVNS